MFKCLSCVTIFDFLEESKQKLSLLLSNELVFNSSSLLYISFIEEVQKIQEILFKQYDQLSVFHMYSCSENQVNQNVQIAPDNRKYDRHIIFDSKKMSAILFLPVSNKLAQTPLILMLINF